jgi:glycosyltransferase involved in cell wall biosynthesis
MMKEFDLMLVMPVYNEEACIAEVVQSWVTTLDTLHIRYQMLILNDGSKDSTLEALSIFQTMPQVRVIDKPNSGHGPTILLGYRMACKSADWIFQCDSDGEMLPEAFPGLWSQREQYDALFGYRENRIQSKGRALISAVSRMAVKTLFGSGVKDVNTPYRLIRADVMAQFIDRIPDDTFAPNIIVSGELSRRSQRIFNTAVPHQHRRTGQVSIVKWKLWKAAMRSLMQTFRYFSKSRKT